MLTPTAQAGVRDNLRASVDLGTNINGLLTGRAQAGVPGESHSVELESKPCEYDRLRHGRMELRPLDKTAGQTRGRAPYCLIKTARDQKKIRHVFTKKALPNSLVFR